MRFCDKQVVILPTLNKRVFQILEHHRRILKTFTHGILAFRELPLATGLRVHGVPARWRRRRRGRRAYSVLSYQLVVVLAGHSPCFHKLLQNVKWNVYSNTKGLDINPQWKRETDNITKASTQNSQFGSQLSEACKVWPNVDSLGEINLIHDL